MSKIGLHIAKIITPSTEIIARIYTLLHLSKFEPTAEENDLSEARGQRFFFRL